MARLLLFLGMFAHSMAGQTGMDLLWDSVDDNGIPKNPRWRWEMQTGAIPNPTQLCASGESGFSLCTTQNVTFDDHPFCRLVPGFTSGHVNWPTPSTYEGTLYWGSHSCIICDNDYTLQLVPSDGRAGLTTGANGSIRIEFDAGETAEQFRTSWWTSFRNAVGNSDQAAKAMVDGKYAIVTGLPGLDCAHTCGTELHPVWAIAIHVKEDPNDDVWAIFLRNWGNEGFCSRKQHQLANLKTFTFRLPWRGNANGVQVLTGRNQTQMQANVQALFTPWAIKPDPGNGVLLQFTLPAPGAYPRLDGEVHLRWTGAAGPPEQITAPPPPADEPEEDDIEEILERTIESLSWWEKLLLYFLIPPKAVDPDRIPPPQPAQSELIAAPGAQLPQAIAFDDPTIETKTIQRIQALCTVVRDALPPPLRDFCTIR